MLHAMVRAFPRTKERKRYSAVPVKSSRRWVFIPATLYLAPNEQRCISSGRARSINLMGRGVFAFRHRAGSILLHNQCDAAVRGLG